jgi:hypothetical protein
MAGREYRLSVGAKSLPKNAKCTGKVRDMKGRKAKGEAREKKKKGGKREKKNKERSVYIVVYREMIPDSSPCSSYSREADMISPVYDGVK